MNRLRRGRATWLTALLLPNVASAALTIVIESGSLDPSLSALLEPSCPGVLVGGGLDTEDLDLQLSSSFPWLDEGSQWRASAFNTGTAQGTMVAAAICTDEALALGVSGQTIELPGVTTSTASTECGAGESALHGGVNATGLVGERWTASIAPTWRDSPSGPRLHQQPDGAQAGPTGWVAVEKNASGFPATLSVSVLCASGVDTVAVVESRSIGSTRVGSATVLCPTGMTAVGGGADSASPDGLRVVASAPVFVGFPSATRITDLGDGATSAQPIGWRMALRNELETAHDIKAAAICIPAPEPAAGALMAFASLTLLSAGRRRTPA